MARWLWPTHPRSAALGLIAGLCLAVAPFRTEGAAPSALQAAAEDEPSRSKGPTLVAPKGPSLMMPMMNSQLGRTLFAAKGCVICHAIHGIGGHVAPRLDARLMPPFVSPFDFVVRMWRGAPAMIVLQEKNLGYQIELTGEELAHIIAFAHDHDEQQKFSAEDIPPWIRTLMKPEDLGVVGD
jgi:hypothetical protein